MVGKTIEEARIMETIPLVIAGFGNVGRAFYTMLEDKAQDLEKNYGLRFEVRLIAKSNGCHETRTGSLGLRNISRNGRPWLEGNPSWHPGLTIPEALRRMPEGGCLVECTPSDLKTGQPGYDDIRAAFESGWSAVTAEKGALVVGYRKLHEMAAARGLGFGLSGATAAALPTIDVARISIAGAKIESIQGILNGTSNYLLTRMSEGLDYAESLRDAQSKGIAEPDPSYDVNGWDTAAKILILANACLNTDYSMSDVLVKGIADIEPAFLQEKRLEGNSVKLMATASPRRRGPGWRLEVMPSVIDSSHPLFHVDGTEKGITFYTDSMGAITVTGGRSNPRGAAAALLKDLINICRGMHL